ncbi:hypothetical protein HEK616_07480 [Streptomyces nigrescens]|uniref:Secreted protein n=1 Tax=Streptomyces nigrescens TaxID=1920 RepID=A0ABM7ZLT6_STRNI|nr:hypothetical protein HEK616_07480 [Streptomyces nigrescens]
MPAVTVPARRAFFLTLLLTNINVSDASPPRAPGVGIDGPAHRAAADRTAGDGPISPPGPGCGAG